MGIFSGGGTNRIASVTVSGAAAASQVIQASSASAASWAYPPGFEIGYTQITAGVNVASTTEATGTTIISPGALVFDGSPVICHFFSPSVKFDTAAAGDLVVVSLFESSTQIGRLCSGESLLTATQNQHSLTGFLRFTPSAASHTYTVTAFATSTTGTPSIGAGASGTGAYVPAFVRFTKV